MKASGMALSESYKALRNENSWPSYENISAKLASLKWHRNNQ
jgi:hypothetical protein